MASILLVDDDFDSTGAMAELLSQAGHEVRHLPDGREALAAVVDSVPDLVILDLKMPVMDGIEFLKVVRSYHRLASVPVILFTAYYNADAEEQAAKLGVMKVFVKGKDEWADLLGWVEQHFGSPQPR